MVTNNLNGDFKMKKEMKEMLESGFDFGFENGMVCLSGDVDFKNMKKEELVGEVEKLVVCYSELKEFSVKLLELYSKKGGGKGRKEELKEIMLDGKNRTIDELSEEMTLKVGKKIDNKNISSLLSYLRRDEKDGKLKDSEGNALYLLSLSDGKMLSRIPMTQLLQQLASGTSVEVEKVETKTRKK